MSYPRRTIWLEPRGVVSDLPPYKVPDQYLTGVENMLFRDGIAERIRGQRTVYDTVQTNVLSLMNVLVGTSNYWVYHGTSASYVASESGHTDLTHASGLTAVDAAHQWSQCKLNGVPCANNTKNAPMYWDGNLANNYVTLTDWPAGATCEFLLAHRYHLFALGMHESGGDYPNKIMWSAAAAPGSIPSSWTPSASNDAGDTELSQDGSPIRTGATLRGTLLVYKTNAVWAVEWVGGQNKYEPVPLFTNFGALTRRSVVDLNGQHFVVGDGEIYLTDGSGFLPIGTSKARRRIFDQLDQTNYEMLFVEYNKNRNEVYVCYPSSGNSFCDKAEVYSLDFKEWGSRDIPTVSCAGRGIESDDAPSQIIDDQSAVIDTVNTPIDALNYSLATESVLLGVPGTPSFVRIDTDDSQSVAARIQRHDLTLGASERVKLVRRLHVMADNYQTLYARIGSRMDPAGPITWSPEVTLTAPQSTVDAFACGKYISVEVRSDDTAPWRLGRLGLETEFRGYA